MAIHRKLRIEKLAPRLMMTRDINHDGEVSSADALIVLNRLGELGSAEVDTSSKWHKRYSNWHDVNRDGRNTALDALLIINTLSQEEPPPLPVQTKHVVTFRLGNIETHGLNREGVLAGIEDFFKRYEEVPGTSVDFRITNNGTYLISSGELYLGNGRHARGWVRDGIGGRHIQFHNGYVGPGHGKAGGVPNTKPFYYSPITSSRQLGQILAHEFGHTGPFRWGHSNDSTCMMHINAPNSMCRSEIDAIRRAYD